MKIGAHGDLQTGLGAKVSESWQIRLFSWGSALIKGVLRKDFHISHMEPDDSSAAPGGARFELTRWSVVLEASQSRAPGGPKALAQLCARYWQPLYGFAHGRGYTAVGARDVVQPTKRYVITKVITSSAIRSDPRLSDRSRVPSGRTSADAVG